MPLNIAALTSDLDAMIADLPATLIYRGKSIPCAATDLGKPIVFEDTVTSYKREVVVTANLGNFPQDPESEQECQLIFFGSKNTFAYLISNVTVHADRVGVTLNLRANQDRLP